MTKLQILAIFIIGIFVSRFAICQELQIINTEDDFRIFWTQAKEKDLPQQKVLWKTFEEKYRDIYDAVVFPKYNPNWDKDRATVLERAFERMPMIESELFDSLARANSVANSQVKRFKAVFPDLEDGTPVIFLPVSQANGSVISAEQLPVYGRSSLVIGLDTILNLRNDLNVVFSHEFFHIYHLKQLEKSSFGETMSTQLWLEGFATFESSLLNPSADYRAIFMDAKLAAACNPKNVRKWSEQYLKIYALPVDSDLLKSWFRVSGIEEPKRRGYCVGFNVIKLLSRKASLFDMAKWDEKAYVDKTGWALKKLAIKQ